MVEIKKNEWEESYSRNDNFMLYPKEEVVKFINRFIKKKTSLTGYVNILQSDEKLKALDFGCGIGRITVLLHEFDIEAYGIDISENAINEAKKFAKYFKFNLSNNFQSYNGKKIPFKDKEFDFTISEAVLDSLPFELAKELMKEIDRVTKKYFFKIKRNIMKIIQIKDSSKVPKQLTVFICSDVN
jgi:ubiquinone/menaquinone biosynthesis C-methylase UbiE